MLRVMNRVCVVSVGQRLKDYLCITITNTRQCCMMRIHTGGSVKNAVKRLSLITQRCATTTGNVIAAALKVNRSISCTIGPYLAKDMILSRMN